jgi:hypothetical protein
MPSNNSLFKFIKVLGLAFLLGFFIEESWAGTLPQNGFTLPRISLELPSKKQEIHYLGLGPGTTFTLDKVDSPIILIEIVGVYCPECHRQLPVLNQLFFWIQKDPTRAKKVKMMAIAVGATSMEVDHLKKEHRISFPVIKDPYFVIHKQIGEPRTPFTLLVAKDRKVLLVHQGVIEDLNKFLDQVKSFIQ